MFKRIRLRLENLEDRTVPTAGALYAPWPDPGHLTLSFAPDGTSVAGGSSNLFQALDAATGSSPAAWEQTILQAFQTWAQFSNVNISVVGDDGLPLGTPGLVQGDPRFGDIRIAAVPLASGAVATATGFQPSGTTWSGDVVFNSNYSFGAGPGQYDLFTVALHEAGHVFGLADETTDPSSVEYQTYTGPRTGLGAGDVQFIQSQYGVRTNSASNNSFANATDLNSAGTTSVSTFLSSSGNINTNQEVDYYSFETGSGSHPNGVTVQLQASQLSLLTSQVTVFDAAGNSVASTSTINPLSNDLAIHLDSVAASAKYYVSVQGSQANAFGIGAYQLAVNLQPTAASLNSSGQFAGAQALPQVGDVNTLGTTGPIGPGNDANVYSFKTQNGPYPNGLTVSLQTWGTALGDPTLALYDAAGTLLSANYSFFPNGTFTLHFGSVAADTTYYVRESTPVVNGASSGGYLLQVNLNAPANSPPPLSPTLQNSLLGVVGGLLGVVGDVVGGVLGLLGLGASPSSSVTTTNLTTEPGYAPQTKYQAVSSVTSPSEKGYFRILSAPAPAGATTDVMTVSVFAQNGQELNPMVQVFNNQMEPVNAFVMTNATGIVIVQVPNAAPNTDYLIEVGAAKRPNESNTGLILLNVAFDGPAAPANQSFLSDTLTKATPQETRALTIGQDGVFAFELSATTPSGAAAAEVQMYIYNANGGLVFSMVSYAGQQATTGTVYLQSGTYSVVFVAVPKTGGALSPLAFVLSGMELTNPMGPQPTDSSGGNSSSGTGSSSVDFANATYSSISSSSSGQPYYYY